MPLAGLDEVLDNLGMDAGVIEAGRSGLGLERYIAGKKMKHLRVQY